MPATNAWTVCSRVLFLRIPANFFTSFRCLLKCHLFKGAWRDLLLDILQMVSSPKLTCPFLLYSFFPCSLSYFQRDGIIYWCIVLKASCQYFLLSPTQILQCHGPWGRVSLSLCFLYSDVAQELFAEIMTFTFRFFSQAGDHYHRQAYMHCPG